MNKLEIVPFFSRELLLVALARIVILRYYNLPGQFAGGICLFSKMIALFLKTP